MENPSYITLSRQTVLRRQMDVLANNLANMSTPAFKSEALLVIQQETPISTQGPRGLRSVSFVKDLATVRDMSEGQLYHTDNPLDLAISGDGYFTVETEDGERYTRHGAFLLDGEGRLTTISGHPVLTEDDDEIVVPGNASEVEVAQDGTLSVRDPANPTVDLVIGRLKIVGFENDHQLKREADGLYRPGDGAVPVSVEQPKVMQGTIEKSNVNGIVEMTRLIETVRTYQSATNVMDEEHERMRRAIQTLTQSSLSA